MDELDVCKDDVSLEDICGSFTINQAKALRLNPDGDFEVGQLDENPSRLVKIGVGIPYRVKNTLIECLRANTYLFYISPHELPDIDLTMVCH